MTNAATPSPRESRHPREAVIPAKAGIQDDAPAGNDVGLDSRFRGNDVFG
jgi:hypothetical protein